MNFLLYGRVFELMSSSWLGMLRTPQLERVTVCIFAEGLVEVLQGLFTAGRV